MKLKVTKRVLSFVMTMFMLLSSVSMLFAYADGETEHTCVDESPKDHYCDTCGKAMKSTAVDFTVGTTSSDTVTYTTSGIIFTGNGGRSYYADLSLKSSGYVLLGHKYEITYWVTGNSDDTTILSIYNEGSTYGWGFRSGAHKRIWWGGTELKGLAFEPDVNAVDDRVYYKVVFDGIEKVMSIFVLSDGEYKLANEQKGIKVTENSYFRFNMSCTQTMFENEFTELGGVNIAELCEDVTVKDHKCDYCGAINCFDNEEDGDHACDYCGEADITTCFDANDDGDHRCDDCGKRRTTVCKNQIVDHVCDTDSKCEVFKYCVDEDEDEACDLCGKEMHECVDVQLNGTDESGYDHLCDICGKPGLGSHTDSNTDEDHFCDECGKLIAEEPCVDEDIDHYCDFPSCGKPMVGEAVDFSNVTINPDIMSYTENGIKFIGSGTKEVDLSFKADVYPLLSHQYEITYWFNAINNDKTALSIYNDGANRYGWGFRDDMPHTIFWYVNTSFVQVDLTFDRDTDSDGKSYFKVIFDGIEKKMSLYLLSSGEYKLVETREITVTDNSYLRFNMYCVETLETGQYTELGDLTVTGLCYDLNKNHKCDYCGKDAGKCSDIATDGDHKCDHCGADNATECFDAKADGDHKCEDCGADNASECRDGSVIDHICEMCCKIIPSLHKDDDKDHFCDVCTDVRINGFCVDTNSDNLCDHCGVSMEHDEIDDNKDHRCDRCGAEVGVHRVSGVEHLCEYCGKGNDTVIDFSSETSVDQNADGIYVSKVEDGVVIKGPKDAGVATSAGVKLDVDKYPLLGYQYEVFFNLSMSSIEQKVGFSIVKDNDGKILGWTTTNNNTDQLKRLWDGKVLNQVISAERDCGENNRQYFKALVDGINHKIAIYVMKNGEYVKVDEIAHIFDSNDYLMLGLFYDARLGAFDYIEMRGVTIRNLHWDIKKDHKCDKCRERIGVCYDFDTSDGDHNCDICGNPSVNSVCSNFNNDHKCDTDSKCNAYVGCYDDNNDHKCDANYCATVYGDHVDADKDHFCDVCTGVRVNGNCVDADSDKLCDYCDADLSKTLIDFTSKTNSGQLTYTESGVRIDGVGTGYIMSSALALNKPILNNKYEINYWMDSNTDARAAFSLIANAPDSDGNVGRLGWAFSGTDLTKAMWYNDGSSKGTVTTSDRDVVENKQYFKVVIDGKNITDGYGTLSLYVWSDGEYKLADERKIAYNAGSSFSFVLLCFDTLAAGEHIEIGGLAIS